MSKTFIKFFTLLFLILNIFTNKISAGSQEQCPNCKGFNTVWQSTTLTCTTDEAYFYHCNDCGNNFQVNTVTIAPGHHYVQSNYTAPTCTKDGSVTYTCDNTLSMAATCGDTYTETLPATGHTWQIIDELEPTCTEDGYVDKKCSVCNETEHEVIESLGHDYKYKTITEVSCENDGLRKYTCSRCNDTYEKTITKLGHNFKETENVLPTCESDGYITKVCKNCKKEVTEVIKALGHNVEFKINKEATCTEDGTKSGICETCKKEVIETIPALGHKYPETWTIEKEASIFTEGIESKTCSVCGNKETQTIAKKEVPVAVPVTAGTVSVATAVFIALKKTGKLVTKKAVKKVVDKTSENVAEKVTKELLEPEFEDKTIVVCIKQDDFYKSMKLQKHLAIVESEYKELSSSIEENEPSLTIIDISNKKLNEVKDDIEKIRKELKEKEIDVTFSLLVSKKQLINQKELLEELKKSELIKDYACIDSNASVNLVKLVLPVMKPNLKSDEGLTNIGMVADALNIPGISTIIDLYVNGRDIKTTIEENKEDGLGFVDKATIISDLASILGLDTLANVSGLVGDVDDIKTSLEAKLGGNEVSTIKDAATDIVDVVSDVISK